MKIQKKWLYILLAAAGVFGVVTILFFSGENGCVMAGIISLTGRSPLHLGSACSGRSC